MTSDAHGETTPKQPRSWRRFLLKLSKWFLGITILLMGIGYVWNALAQKQFHETHEPAGEIVKAGDSPVHVVRRGKRKLGRPIVIIDHCLGGICYEWLHVVDEVAEYTEVLVWDRPGNGLSPPGTLPRTPERNVQHLLSVLEKLNAKPPYILVGNSLGGFNMRLLASEHPEDVSGVILIDAFNADHLELNEEMRPPLFIRGYAATEVVGLPRLIAAVGGNPFPHRSNIRGDLIFDVSVNGYHGILDEWTGVGNQWTERGLKLPSLGEIPTTVITATGPPNADVLQWAKGQELLASVADDAKVINTTCHHMVHLDRPKLVCREIRAMFDAATQEASN